MLQLLQLLQPLLSQSGSNTYEVKLLNIGYILEIWISYTFLIQILTKCFFSEDLKNVRIPLHIDSLGIVSNSTKILDLVIFLTFYHLSSNSFVKLFNSVMLSDIWSMFLCRHKAIYKECVVHEIKLKKLWLWQVFFLQIIHAASQLKPVMCFFIQNCYPLYWGIVHSRLN